MSSVSPFAVIRAGDTVSAPPSGESTGLSIEEILGPWHGAAHLAAAHSTLAPSGMVLGHAHPFEESFFVLDGRAVVTIADTSYEVAAGDFGFAPFSTPHAWANPFGEPAKWLRVRAPIPRVDGRTVATRPVPGFLPSSSAPRVDPFAPDQRYVGHFSDQLVTAPGPIAMPGYRGYGINDVSIRMMVDEFIGAEHHTLFVVQFAPSQHFSAKEHFHPYEELYYFTHGTADGLIGGESHRIGAGDLVFAGVNAAHGFTNAGDVPVRWIEAQAPKPPPRNGTAFIDDWSLTER